MVDPVGSVGSLSLSVFMCYIGFYFWVSRRLLVSTFRGCVYLSGSNNGYNTLEGRRELRFLIEKDESNKTGPHQNDHPPPNPAPALRDNNIPARQGR